MFNFKTEDLIWININREGRTKTPQWQLGILEYHNFSEDKEIQENLCRVFKDDNYPEL
jgi:hypothetical protein